MKETTHKVKEIKGLPASRCKCAVCDMWCRKGSVKVRSESTSSHVSLVSNLCISCLNKIFQGQILEDVSGNIWRLMFHTERAYKSNKAKWIEYKETTK